MKRSFSVVGAVQAVKKTARRQPDKRKVADLTVEELREILRSC